MNDTTKMILTGVGITIASVVAAVIVAWITIKVLSFGQTPGLPYTGPSPAAQPECYLYFGSGGPNTISKAALGTMSLPSGTTIATLQQIARDYGNGATWCWWGWVYDEAGKDYIQALPMTEDRTDSNGNPMCGGGLGMHQRTSTAPSNVVLYGVKPPKETAKCGSSTKNCCAPFQQLASGASKWSLFD